MATTHLDRLQYLKTLRQTPITSLGIQIIVNGFVVDPWLNQALVPYIRPALIGYFKQIFDDEKAQAGPEIDAIIAADQAQLAADIALKNQLGV